MRELIKHNDDPEISAKRLLEEFLDACGICEEKRSPLRSSILSLVVEAKALPRLSAQDIVSLKAHAEMRPWLRRCEFGYPRICSPLAFIEKEYKFWLDRGMTRSELRSADRDLVIRLEQWLQTPENAVPDNFLPVRGADVDPIVAELSPDRISAVFRLFQRNRKRAARSRAEHK